MYRVEFWTDEVAEAIDALPHHLLVAFAEVRAALELSPWTVGMPFAQDNPDIPSRTVVFGPDDDQVMITIGIRETDAHVVSIVQLIRY